MKTVDVHSCKWCSNVYILPLSHRFNGDLKTCKHPQQEYSSDVTFHELVSSVAMAHQPNASFSKLIYVPFYFSRHLHCLTVEERNALMQVFVTTVVEWIDYYPKARFFMHAASVCSCVTSCNPLAGHRYETRLSIIAWERDPDDHVVAPYFGKVLPTRVSLPFESRPITILNTAQMRTSTCTYCSVCLNHSRTVGGGDACAPGCNNVRPQMYNVLGRHIHDKTIVSTFGKEGVSLMSRSKFCLMPPGDTLTRAGTYQAIQSNCIPVFFRGDDAFLRQHALRNRVNYTKLSIVVDASVDFVNQIKRIPAKRILVHRHAVAKAARLLNSHNASLFALLDEVYAHKPKPSMLSPASRLTGRWILR